ncbi:hypothetical protein [Treponema endosymbiont of Eucomonympha sp.]|uniref:hypothetical protein n=1 Tax=Treponema endosymbiont of Eucomonympha sp. TaxID=1580831 RepID=UPI0007816185|nr:hypothetical protein [Treponema endosymbiont of Eucomonympha sp.]
MERGHAAVSRIRLYPYAFYFYAIRGFYLSAEFPQGTAASLCLTTELALQTRGDKGYRRTRNAPCLSFMPYLLSAVLPKKAQETVGTARYLSAARREPKNEHDKG